MADYTTKTSCQDESIDEIVLIFDNVSGQDESIENPENEFLKKLSLTGFKNEKFGRDLELNSQIDSIKNINLNDVNLPKVNPKTKKREHNGIPFIRTNRSVTTQSYCNKENKPADIDTESNKDKDRALSSLSKLKPPTVKKPIPSQIPIGNNRNTNCGNFRVPFSVKPNPTGKPVMVIPRLASYMKPKPATMPQSPKLSTSIRAEERQRYNLQLKEKENQMKLRKQKEDETKEKDSSKKLEILRKNLIHKPEPIRKYHP